ncbi:MAG: adenylate/guanylate cyclase domain-containing protein [Actinobacteria bacterium]|nr:adenylate/guanylate cyclase domain-containing protein [Actinomycetota bacterium]
MDTKLATIICSDVIGYSSLMQRDEAGTLAKLDACRAIIDPLIDSSKGRLFNTGGDSVLIEFASAVDAVRFGIEMQSRLSKLNNGMRWRVGMHVGEVWIYGTNLMGDAVNLAARCESLADLGGVTMTDAVYRLVNSKIKDHKFISRGIQEFKNVEPMEIWSVEIEGSSPNPGLNKTVRKTSTTTKSHAEMIAAVLNDQAARNRTLNDAMTFKHDNKYGPATRVLMWRVSKQDIQALDELINMLQKNLVPIEFKPYVHAVFREFCTKINSDLAIKIADLVESDSRSLAIQFLRQAAKVNEQASYRLAIMVFSDPNSSDSEIEHVIGDLRESAMKRRVPAMISLGKYYLQISDKKNAFRWLYAARAEHDTSAQKLLEDLNKTISKAEFNNFKTDADALVDEIKFIDENRMR